MQLVFNIPDLSDLSSRSISLAMRRFFTSSGPKGGEAYALVMNFVRLVDLAVSEYKSGRLAILEFANSNEELRLGSAIRSSAHFEVCIDALKRAINHLKAIRGNPTVPQDLKGLLPRGINLISGEVESKVTQMRHAIQHLEERIQKGEIIEGQSLALQPTRDDLQLGPLNLRYVELAGWITEAHTLSATLIGYHET
jgi:hypothetical protein